MKKVNIEVQLEIRPGLEIFHKFNSRSDLVNYFNYDIDLSHDKIEVSISSVIVKNLGSGADFNLRILKSNELKFGTFGDYPDPEYLACKYVDEIMEGIQSQIDEFV